MAVDVISENTLSIIPKLGIPDIIASTVTTDCSKPTGKALPNCESINVDFSLRNLQTGLNTLTIICQDDDCKTISECQVVILKKNDIIRLISTTCDSWREIFTEQRYG